MLRKNYDSIKNHIQYYAVTFFIQGLFCDVYERHKHLKDLIAPSSYPIKTET